MWRSACAAGCLFILAALGWAFHDPLMSSWEVRALSSYADPLDAEGSLWERGRGSVWALRRGVAGGDGLTRLRCARLLALLGDEDADRVLYEALSGTAQAQAILAERLLRSVWDLRKGPSTPEELEVLRRVREPRGTDASTERDLDLLLETHRGWAAGYVLRAQRAFENGDLQAAMQDALRVLDPRFEPGHFIAAQILGRCYLKLGFSEQAHFCFEHAQAVNPRLNRSELEQARKEAAVERERRLRERFRDLPTG